MKPSTMRFAATLAGVIGTVLVPPAVLAADAPAGKGAAAAKSVPATKVAKVHPRPRPATSREQLRDKAKGLALVQQTVQQITEAQLAVAERVLVGESACEFNQTVSVRPIDGRPGHFRVGYKKAVYTMVPEETTTGAVRLEDKKAGIVWLQIPVKSMLMNSRIGQRMVDSCMHAEQRAAVEAAQAAQTPAAAAPTTN